MGTSILYLYIICINKLSRIELAVRFIRFYFFPLFSLNLVWYDFILFFPLFLALFLRHFTSRYELKWWIINKRRYLFFFYLFSINFLRNAVCSWKNNASNYTNTGTHEYNHKYWFEKKISDKILNRECKISSRRKLKVNQCDRIWERNIWESLKIPKNYAFFTLLFKMTAMKNWNNFCFSFGFGFQIFLIQFISSQFSVFNFALPFLVLDIEKKG